MKEMANKKRYSPKRIKVEVKPSFFLEQKISLIIMILAASLAAFSIIFGLSVERAKADNSTFTRGFFIPAYFVPADFEQYKAELNAKFDLMDVPRNVDISGIDSEKIIVINSPGLSYSNSWGRPDEWNVVNSHEDWFMHSSLPATSENRIPLGGYPQLYYMDVGAEGWKNFIASLADQTMTNYPTADGVYIDGPTDPDEYESILGPGLAYPEYDKNTYISKISTFLSAIKNAVNQKMVILNSNLYKPFTTDMDGGLAEGFVHFGGWPNSRQETKVQWLAEINQISDTEFNGKYILIGSGSLEVTLPSMVEYCYASFLIGYNPSSHAYFYWHSNAEGGYGTLYWTSLWDMDIGEPTGNYYVENGIYKRNFTNGLVLVNPQNSGTGYDSVTVNLGSNYINSSGQTVYSVTLTPKTSAVLMKGDQTAPAAVNDLSSS